MAETDKWNLPRRDLSRMPKVSLFSQLLSGREAGTCILEFNASACDFESSHHGQRIRACVVIAEALTRLDIGSETTPCSSFFSMKSRKNRLEILEALLTMLLEPGKKTCMIANVVQGQSPIDVWDVAYELNEYAEKVFTLLRFDSKKSQLSEASLISFMGPNWAHRKAALEVLRKHVRQLAGSDGMDGDGGSKEVEGSVSGGLSRGGSSRPAPVLNSSSGAAARDTGTPSVRLRSDVAAGDGRSAAALSAISSSSAAAAGAGTLCGAGMSSGAAGAPPRSPIDLATEVGQIHATFTSVLDGLRQQGDLSMLAQLRHFADTTQAKLFKREGNTTIIEDQCITHDGKIEYLEYILEHAVSMRSIHSSMPLVVYKAAQQITDALFASTCRVIASDDDSESSGTGTLLFDRFILTARHVCSTDSEAAIKKLKIPLYPELTLKFALGNPSAEAVELILDPPGLYIVGKGTLDYALFSLTTTLEEQVQLPPGVAGISTSLVFAPPVTLPALLAPDNIGSVRNSLFGVHHPNSSELPLVLFDARSMSTPLYPASGLEFPVHHAGGTDNGSSGALLYNIAGEGAALHVSGVKKTAKRFAERRLNKESAIIIGTDASHATSLRDRNKAPDTGTTVTKCTAQFPEHKAIFGSSVSPEKEKEEIQKFNLAVPLAAIIEDLKKRLISAENQSLQRIALGNTSNTAGTDPHLKTREARSLLQCFLQLHKDAQQQWQQLPLAFQAPAAINAAAVSTSSSAEAAPEEEMNPISSAPIQLQTIAGILSQGVSAPAVTSSLALNTTADDVDMS